jgi:hypothetical protein
LGTCHVPFEVRMAAVSFPWQDALSTRADTPRAASKITKLTPRMPQLGPVTELTVAGTMGLRVKVQTTTTKSEPTGSRLV